jgi:hypothetical protein
MKVKLRSGTHHGKVLEVDYDTVRIIYGFPNGNNEIYESYGFDEEGFKRFDYQGIEIRIEGGHKS